MSFRFRVPFKAVSTPVEPNYKSNFNSDSSEKEENRALLKEIKEEKEKEAKETEEKQFNRILEEKPEEEPEPPKTMKFPNFKPFNLKTNKIEIYDRQGPTGPKGDVGITGLQGPLGPTGPKGEKGEKGQDGRDGVDGNDGEDGKNGEDGVTIKTVLINNDSKLEKSWTDICTLPFDGTKYDLHTILVSLESDVASNYRLIKNDTNLVKFTGRQGDTTLDIPVTTAPTTLCTLNFQGKSNGKTVVNAVEFNMKGRLVD